MEVSATSGHGGGAPWLGDSSRSPVMVFTVGAIVTAFVAVGFLAAYMPRSAPMDVPVVLLVASGVLSIAGIVSLRQRPGFAWRTFFAVARWILVVTVVFAGMAEFVFAYDKATGSPLVVMTLVLVLAAVNVPVAVGFSVARHEAPAIPGERPAAV